MSDVRVSITDKTNTFTVETKDNTDVLNLTINFDCIEIDKEYLLSLIKFLKEVNSFLIIRKQNDRNN